MHFVIINDELTKKRMDKEFLQRSLLFQAEERTLRILQRRVTKKNKAKTALNRSKPSFNSFSAI